MNITTALRISFFLPVLLFQNTVLAHVQKAAQERQTDAFNSQKVVTSIANSLEQDDSDTSRFFIIKEVRDHCKGDYDCLLHTYDAVLKKLEEGFNFFPGLLVAKEMVKLAKQNKDIEAQASATSRLAGIYGFMSDQEMMMFYEEELRSLYEQIGDIEKALQTKFNILEGRVWYLGEAADALPEMEKVVEQALEKGFTNLANRFRIRLKYIYEEHGFEEKLIQQVEALENIPYSNPLQPSELHLAFHAASGRGDLLLKEKEYDAAKKHYQKGLNIFENRENTPNDVWLQIYALFRLAELEWERRDTNEAKKFIQEAYDIAEETKMYERSIKALNLMTEIAVAEKHFEDAYLFTLEIQSNQEILDSIAGGFDTEKYELQLQKEYLQSEKMRQTLELRLSKNRFISMIVIIGLLVLFMMGFLVSFFKQRKDKLRITDQYTLIQHQAEQLKQLDTAKTRFFANVSHELRTPLTLILGPINTLLKGQHSSEQKEKLLNIALQNSLQLRQLVNEILDLQKLENTKIVLHEEPTELFSFFKRYTAQFESLAMSNGIAFPFETNIEKGVTATIDREKCRQILQNLLSNAFKFTFEGGQVTTKIFLDKNILTMEVADTGIGIHSNDLPHIFDRYYQTSRPEKVAQGGTGIGLALCKEYVKLLGGRMEVESPHPDLEDKGSVFRVIFPVTVLEGEQEVEAITESQAAIQLKSKPENANVQKAVPSERPTILVVEDNLDLQQYLQFILQEHYQVVITNNGKQALDYLEKNTDCQLVLSDLMMPVMDGYQLLEKLKSENNSRHIPVIMLTARAEAKDKLKALRIGVDDYLAKPFDEEELKVRIKNLLANQAVRKKVAADMEQSTDTPDISKPDEEWLENFEAYIQRHLANDILTVSFLAQEFAMSESTLLRQVTQLTGLSPKQYLQEARLHAARHMLENKTYRTVSKVAEKAGYSNTRTFSRNFKDRFGKSPSHYFSS